MFNDRDLGVLGAGAVLSVACLLLPFAFAGKVALGFGVLVGFMILAFLRLGPDRIPPEAWLRRRIRYHLQARRYTYQQSRRVSPHRQPLRIPIPRLGVPALGQNRPAQADPGHARAPANRIGAIRPLSLAWEEAASYPTLMLCLAVLSVYLLAWLAGGGAGEIGKLFGGVIR